MNFIYSEIDKKLKNKYKIGTSNWLFDIQKIYTKIKKCKLENPDIISFGCYKNLLNLRKANFIDCNYDQLIYIRHLEQHLELFLELLDLLIYHNKLDVILAFSEQKITLLHIQHKLEYTKIENNTPKIEIGEICLSCKNATCIKNGQYYECLSCLTMYK